MPLQHRHREPPLPPPPPRDFILRKKIRRHHRRSDLHRSSAAATANRPDLDGWLDSSDEEVLQLLNEDAEHEKQVMETIFFFGMYHDIYMHKSRRRTSPESGHEWVMRNIR
ncbi:hypothetical protein U9M48_039363 [Paspalum notatum var. saurae]|uniref:Uncharacterized protein n=1 Tax=Paspalum notatum var. saurae TaxID=547442 RepID=A0AAQ3UKK6_PASNO